jgi:hypothetical protein
MTSSTNMQRTQEDVDKERGFTEDELRICIKVTNLS